MHTTLRESPDANERTFIDQAIANQSGRPGALLGILEAVQEHNPRKYLPMETLRYIAANCRARNARPAADRSTTNFLYCARRCKTPRSPDVNPSFG